MTDASEFRVRDQRNGKWAWVHDAVVGDPHLTDADVRCYLALASFANCKEIRPGISKPAKRASLHERTVRRCISHLNKLGYIAIERGGGDRTNVYFLLKATGGCMLCRAAKKTSLPLAESAPLTENAALTQPSLSPDRKNPGPRAQSAEEQNKQQNKEQTNPLSDPESEDLQAFIQEMAVKEGISPEQVRWRMERIAAKANGRIRSFSYFRVAFTDFITRERYELIEHLTQHGANECRKDQALGILDLTENLKCEAARIGFSDYSDAVSTAVRNLRKGTYDSQARNQATRPVNDGEPRRSYK